MAEALRLSPAAPVTVLNRDQLEDRLAELYSRLKALPEGLPGDVYEFRGFEITEEESEDLGRSGALNRTLERTFCPQGRVNGPFTLKGQGEGLLAVVDVLSRFTAEFPNDVVLQKWIDDLIQAAKHTSVMVRLSPHLSMPLYI